MLFNTIVACSAGIVNSGEVDFCRYFDSEEKAEKFATNLHSSEPYTNLKPLYKISGSYRIRLVEYTGIGESEIALSESFIYFHSYISNQLSLNREGDPNRIAKHEILVTSFGQENAEIAFKESFQIASMVSGRDLKPIVDLSKVQHLLTDGGVCSVENRSRVDGGFVSLVFIMSNQSETEVALCLLDETAGVLGLGSDPEPYGSLYQYLKDVMRSDDNLPNALLSYAEPLYDNRMKLGQTIAETKRIMKTISAENPCD